MLINAVYLKYSDKINRTAKSDKLGRKLVVPIRSPVKLNITESLADQPRLRCMSDETPEFKKERKRAKHGAVLDSYSFTIDKRRCRIALIALILTR